MLCLGEGSVSVERPRGLPEEDERVLGSTAANLDDNRSLEDNNEGGLGGICNYWGFPCTLYVVIKDVIQSYYSIRRSSVNEGMQRQGIRIA